MSEINTKFERGDVIRIKDDHPDDDIPLPDEFQIITVYRAESNDVTPKYESPYGDFVCADLVDRNYKLVDRTQD